MMKWVPCALLLSLSLTAVQKKEPPPPPDLDLFSKDRQILSIHTEFLYWTVAEGALDYALKMGREAWGPSPSYAQGKFEKAVYDMDPGFRLALLYFRAPHYWEMKWQYTRLTSEGHTSCSKPHPDQKFLTGTWPQISSSPLSGAKSHIHLNYNVADWIVDRVFFPNPHLRLRVVGGATLAWMGQDWKVHYFDSTPHTTTIRNFWRYFGGGLKTGTVVDWFWSHDIYMTGLSSFSLLLGTYSNHAKQTTDVQPTLSDNPSIPIRNAHYNDVRPTCNVQMLLGPSWQKSYPSYRIEVFGGFEANLWFNLQEVYRSTSGGPFEAKETWMSSGLLTLYGLTTRVTVDF